MTLMDVILLVLENDHAKRILKLEIFGLIFPLIIKLFTSRKKRKRK